MIEYIKKKWPELLILAIIIPFVGWFVSQTVDYGQRIAVQENRTAQIIASIPDLRTRVARLTTTQSFQTAILVSVPEVEADKWISEVSMIDNAAKQIVNYQIPLQNGKDFRTAFALYGLARGQDDMAIDFQRMKSIALTADITESVPLSIDANTSFLTSASAQSLESMLDELGAVQVQASSLSVPVLDWSDLMARARAGEFMASSGKDGLKSTPIQRQREEPPLNK